MIYEPLPHRAYKPSPAVTFVGRQNSGKTTLLEKVIAELTAQGLSIGTLKHHGHSKFQIDIPGKDSYRHRAAGASATAILSSGRLAFTCDLACELSCFEALELLPNYDLVLVEGFRGVGLPTIELLRAEKPKDQAAADALIARLEADEGNAAGGETPDCPAIPVAVVTDMPKAEHAARAKGLPVFGFEEAGAIASFVRERYARAPLTIAVQAGGESRRMGQSKALTPFLGRPLIEHMLEVVSAFADELIVTTNEKERLAYLTKRYPNLRLVSDVMSERGALPGLLTAVSASTNDAVGVVACDMVAFLPQILVREALALQASGSDAGVPFNGSSWEPFAAVYRKSTCQPVLEKITAQGAKRMRDLIDAIVCARFDAERLRKPGTIDPFANVNTPQELAQAEVLYRMYR